MTGEGRKTLMKKTKESGVHSGNRKSLKGSEQGSGVATLHFCSLGN